MTVNLCLYHQELGRERSGFMPRKYDYVLRLLVKKLEKLPRETRQFLNRFIDLLYFSRTIREKKNCKKLDSSPLFLEFEINRSDGFTKFYSNPSTTDKLIKFALNEKRMHLEGESQKGNSKDYLRQIWDMSKLDNNSLFILEWALQESNLKSISKYFGGKTPILHEVSVFYSPESVVGESSNWQGSQLFHMDGGGTQCVKLWLLCQEVDIEQGPTVVVSADQSSRLAKKLKYKPGTRIENDETLSSLEELKTFSLIGEKGTWYATDTDRSFHYGSRTTERSSRLVFMFHYVDNNSSYYMPILSRHYKRQLKALPSLAREIAEKNSCSFEAMKNRLLA